MWLESIPPVDCDHADEQEQEKLDEQWLLHILREGVNALYTQLAELRHHRAGVTAAEARRFVFWTRHVKALLPSFPTRASEKQPRVPPLRFASVGMTGVIVEGCLSAR
jgi:hypothetical protein